MARAGVRRRRAAGGVGVGVGEGEVGVTDEKGRKPTRNSLSQAVAWSFTVVAGALAILAVAGLMPTAGSGLSRALAVALFGCIALGCFVWSRWTHLTRLEGGAVVLVAVVVAGVAVVLGRQASPEVLITSPVAGEVRSPVIFRGSARNLKHDDELWVLVRPRSANYFTTNQQPLQTSDGSWSLQTTIGRGAMDDGVEYVFTALVFAKKDAQFLRDALLDAGGAGAPAEFTSDELADDLARATARHEVRLRLSVPSSTGGVADIRQPEDKSDVTRPFDVRGTANVPKGRVLWLLVRSENGRLYTTSSAPLAVNGEGRWEHRALTVGRRGRDLNLDFDLLLVSAPEGDSDIARALQDRPEGRIRLTSVRYHATPASCIG